MLISGSEGTKLLQVDYGFKEPRGKEISLVMGFPFRDTREMGFVMDIDKDGNLKVDVKLRKIDEGELKKSWRIAGCKYQKTEYTLKIDGEDVQLKEVLARAMVNIISVGPSRSLAWRRLERKSKGCSGRAYSQRMTKETERWSGCG